MHNNRLDKQKKMFKLLTALSVLHTVKDMITKQKLTFIVESVDSVDAGTLVIATQQEKVFRILYLVRQQEAYCFQRLFSTINIVSKEEVV